MKKAYLLLWVPLSLLFFLAGPRPIFACSCVGNGSVENSFAQATNVVVLKLQGVEKALAGDTYGYGGIKHSKLVVEQSFKGALKAGQVLTFRQGGGGDCVWIFSEESVGSEFLLYLPDSPGKDGLWSGPQCSRSGSVSYRDLDLRYIKEREKRLGKTRISGRLSKRVESAVEGGGFQYLSLPNRKVSISGNGRTFETVSDDLGNYEMYDLEPGTYTIDPEAVPGFAPWGGGITATVELSPRSMVDKDFDFMISNRIRGIFYDTTGKPLKDVCLRLRPAAGKEVQNFFEMDCTDSKGEFEMDQIPAGNYVLVINEDDKVSASQPFRKFYYPATYDRDKAIEIAIGPGQNIDDLVINAPATADTIGVTGRLLLSDRKAATDKNTEYVSIEFFDDADMERQAGQDYKEASSRGELRSDGTFSIRILKGAKGKLVASMNTYEGKYATCPVLDQLVATKGRAMGANVLSTEIRIHAQGDLIDQELVFPFPSTCKKVTPQ
jgi:hypothetical protein